MQGLRRVSPEQVRSLCGPDPDRGCQGGVGGWSLPAGPWDDITAADVELYRKRRLQEVKPATANREVAFLKAVFNQAVRDGRAESNPVSKVKMLKENNSRVRFLSEEEEQALRAGMSPDGFLLVEFAIHTGLRQAEQFNLRWEDVDLRNEVLTVPRSKHGEKRHVPLNDTALRLLRSLKSRLRSPSSSPPGTEKPR